MFYKELHLFSGIIIVETGLSMVIVKDAVRSASAKFGEKERVTIFTETGLFLNTEPSQEKYVWKYLELSNSASDGHILTPDFEGRGKRVLSVSNVKCPYIHNLLGYIAQIEFHSYHIHAVQTPVIVVPRL